MIEQTKTSLYTQELDICGSSIMFQSTNFFQWQDKNPRSERDSVISKIQTTDSLLG